MRITTVCAIALGVLLLASVAARAEDPFIPGTGTSPQQPAAGSGTDKLAETVARLVEENSQLRAELAEKQKQIDELQARVGGDAAGGAAVTVAADAAGDDSDAKAQERASAAAATKGPWVVRVISNEEPTSADLQQQLAAAQAKLPDIDARLSEAKTRRDAILGSTQVLTRDYYNRYGAYRGSGQTTRRTFTVEEQGQARLAVQKIEGERRRAAQTLARLERQMADSGKARTIVGQLDAGTSVEVTAQGEAAMRISRQMVEGRRYRIIGTGTAEGGVVKIKMTGAVAEDAAGAETAAAPAPAAPAARPVAAAAPAAPVQRPVPAGARQPRPAVPAPGRAR